MAPLPIFHTNDKDLSLLQTGWSALINPLLRAPISSGTLLERVSLGSGDTVVGHMLNRKLQGWIPVRFHGGWAQLYDKQDSNPIPDKTLILNASAGVMVDLWVF